MASTYTEKLIQHMFQEGVGLSEDEIVNLLSQGISENIVIMGITDYDFRVNDKIPIYIPVITSSR